MTRKEYMDGDHGNRETAHKLHRAYYAQFVTDEVTRIVRDMIGYQALIQSSDEDGALNDIALHEWDRLPCPFAVGEMLKAQGDYLTLGGKVCIMKEAARQIRESAAVKKGV